MSIKHMNLIKSAIVGASVLGLTGAALAAPPPWSNARVHRDYDRHDARHDHGRRYGYDYERYDYARVVDVQPIYARVRVSEPERDCWYEEREVPRGIDGRTAGPTVLGAIIGGVIGHQFGGGSGRDAATVAGTVIGASVGHSNAARAAGPDVRDVRRCEVSYEDSWEERIDGYRVTYVYGGREYTKRMSYDPGPRLRVQVAVMAED